jgi:putative spermidine/putrescine transport system permease protein
MIGQRTRATTASAWIVGLLLGLPLLLLPVRAFADVWRAPALVPQKWGTRALEIVTTPGTGALEAVSNSVVVGVATTVLALLLGWPAARWLSTAPTRRRMPVLVLLAMPLLVPPLAVGAGLSEWFLRLGLADTRIGLVLAHLVASLPYVVMVLAPAFTPRVVQAEEAARTLGATRRAATIRVTAPMVTPSIAVASLIGFLVSWGQYGTSLGVGGGIPMLPLVLQPFIGRDPQVAAALSLVFFLPALVLLIATTRSTTRAS